MVLEDRTVVVEKGQVRGRVDVKVVGGARVVEVVNHGGDKTRENFQIGNPVLKMKNNTNCYKNNEIMVCPIGIPIFFLFSSMNQDWVQDRSWHGLAWPSKVV